MERLSIFQSCIFQRTLTFFAIFFVTGSVLFAQNQQSSEYIEAKTLLEKVKLNFSRGNNDAAVGFGLLGLDQAEAISDDQLILEFKDLLGDIYLTNNDFEQAIYFFLDVALNAESNNNDELTANGYFSLGNVYSSMGAYNKATNNYTQAYALFEKHGNALGMAEAAQSLGYNYILANQRLKSAGAFELLYGIAKKEKLTQFEILASKQLLQVHNQIGNTELAIEYGEKYFNQIAFDSNTDLRRLTGNLLSELFLKAENFKKAEEYAKVALKISPNDPEYLDKLGLAFRGQENTVDAFSTFNRALTINSEKKDLIGMAKSYNHMALTQYLNKDDRSTLLYLKKSEEIGIKSTNAETLSETCNIYYQLYTRRNNPQQASVYKAKYEQLKNLIVQKSAEDNTQNISREKEILADAYEKEARIQITQAQNKQLALEQNLLKSDQERQQLTLLEQQSKLQEQELRQSALEAERAQQNLLIAQQQFDRQQNQAELSKLQQESELRKLTEQESQKALELSEKERLILEQETELQASKIEADNQAKLLLFGLSGLAIIILIVLGVAYYRTNKTKKIITVQHKNLEHQQKLIHDRNIQLKKSTQNVMIMNSKLQKVQQNLQQTLKKEQMMRIAIQKTNKDLKDAQVHLVQAEKMSSLGQLTAGIAHEINNPVNFVSGGIESLKQNVSELIDTVENYKKICQLDNIEEIKKYYDVMNDDEDELEDLKESTTELFNDIQYGTERIAEIVIGLKDFSRQGEAEVKESDIHENFDSALLILKSKYKNKAEIVKDFDTSIEPIQCFPGQLNQVFVNLIGNAVDALDEQGVITIKTLNLNDDKIQVSIADNGKGMPVDVMEKIFDPFFTTKEVGEGTGLGLSITHGIIEKHDGKIEVNSKVGEGTSFTITLPKQLQFADKVFEEIA